MDKDNKKQFTLRELIGEEYLDYKLSVRPRSVTAYGNTIGIELEKDGHVKYVNHVVDYTHDSRPMTNFVDGVYLHDDVNEGDCSFLWSFEINNKVRAFVGLVNEYFGITYPVGFDLNSKQFVRFPINEYGLMDEKTMKKMIKVLEPINPELGFDPQKYYKSLRHGSIDSIIREAYRDEYFDVDTEIADWILKHLDQNNEDEINKVKDMFEGNTK